MNLVGGGSVAVVPKIQRKYFFWICGVDGCHFNEQNIDFIHSFNPNTLQIRGVPFYCATFGTKKLLNWWDNLFARRILVD